MPVPMALLNRERLLSTNGEPKRLVYDNSGILSRGLNARLPKFGRQPFGASFLILIPVFCCKTESKVRPANKPVK